MTVRQAPARPLPVSARVRPRTSSDRGQVRRDPEAARRAYEAAQALRERLEVLDMHGDAERIRDLQRRLWDRMGQR